MIVLDDADSPQYKFSYGKREEGMVALPYMHARRIIGAAILIYSSCLAYRPTKKKRKSWVVVRMDITHAIVPSVNGQYDNR